MRKVYGISSTPISSREKGLWFDSDERQYQPFGWGPHIDLLVGKMIRPVPKFWIKGNNPWKGDTPWFVIRIPIMIGLFVSVALGPFGFYIGFKTFLVKTKHMLPDRYGKWLRLDEYGTDDDPAEYMQLTASIRRTRWK